MSRPTTLTLSCLLALVGLEELLGEALVEFMEGDDPGIRDVVVGDVADFWHVRHQISESLREEGQVLGLDVSVPRSRMAEFTAEVARRVAEVAPDARVADFGHWGDGGSHLNLVWDPASAPEGRKGELQRIAYDVCVTGFGGSYSAEHCVGPHNVEAYREYTSPWVRDVWDKQCGSVELSMCARTLTDRGGWVVAISNVM